MEKTDKGGCSMQRCKLRSFLSILIILAFVCCICLFWLKISKNPFRKGTPENGKPFYDETVHLYWGEVSDYLICGDKLILLYDEKNAVQFYTLNGDPLFSFEFSFRNNGQSHLHTNGNYLIVEDRSHNYYLFSEDGAFKQYITDEKRKESLQKTFLSTAEERTSNDGSIYELKGASIYKTSPEETVKIVSRPFFMAIFQGPRTILLAFVFGLILFVRYKIWNWRGSNVILSAHEAENTNEADEL